MIYLYTLFFSFRKNFCSVLCVLKLTWTLSFAGSPPLVIARGGFSGIYPDSSDLAYSLAAQTSLANVIVWCDVQLTKDREGICIPSIKLENATDIGHISKYKSKTYSVNGVQTSGYFSVDYTLKELLSNVICKFNFCYRYNFIVTLHTFSN